MNRYIFLQRIQWPVMLLTFGVTALLNEWDVLDFGKSWPLYLIVFGVLKLAQRAALVNVDAPSYYGAYPQTAQGVPVQTPPASTSLVPTDSSSPSGDFGDRR